MEEIMAFLDMLKVGRSQSHENLALFPLMAPDTGPPDYLTLEEALAEGTIRVTELTEGGSVPEIKVLNSSAKAVLVVDGEELVGAKQNRIVNATFLVPGKAEVVIPVSCVEQGRWAYRSRGFESGERLMHASLRRDHQRAVGESLLTQRKYSSDQGMIWSELSLKAARMSVESPTGAMADLFEGYRDRLGEYTRAFRLVECQVGAVFALNGRMAGMECFFHQATFGKFFRKLVESYALDALDYRFSGNEDLAPVLEEPMGLLKGVRGASYREYPAIGLGRSVRLEAEGLSGAALVKDEKVLHMNVFINEGFSSGGRVGLQRFSQRRRRAGR